MSSVTALRTRLSILFACTAVVVAVFVALAVHTASAESAAPRTPSAADGVIGEGDSVSLDDEALPAIANLDPALRDAVRRAAADAGAAGIPFVITSGWRSAHYQQWLLDDAMELYASEAEARRFVATPDVSSHVSGRAVDIGPVDAQFWLIEHGAAYGLCQTYANERWHFELATTPGGVCPAMKLDAAS